LSNISDFMDEKMLELFFADTNEMLETSIDDILEIENGYNRELLDNIMRTMHSIKGGSAMLELKDVEYFSHNLEDYFIKLRDRVLEINVEWIDDLIDGVNTLKKWIGNREKIFKEKQDFTIEIAEEKADFDRLLSKVVKEKKTEENIVKGFVTKDEKLEKIKTGHYRLELYFDESAPMFEIKRAIIKKAIEEIGEIKDSIPSSENIMDNSINYYKLILKSEKSKEEIIKKTDITDVYFVSISEGVADIEEEHIEREVYMKKDAKFETINFIYEDILQMVRYGKIKKVFTEGRKSDIYGIQIFELLKKEQGTIII
jgi:two-component system, chemotaxis family, sensor kinase CheA